jgi:DNA-damage-inducible protein J
VLLLFCRRIRRRKGGGIMAETTNLNIRIDKKLKEQAETFFGELGLNMTTAINIFVRQSLRQGKIPFEISISPDPVYSPSNLAVLRRSIQEADEGKFVTKTLDELRAMEE